MAPIIRILTGCEWSALGGQKLASRPFCLAQSLAEWAKKSQITLLVSTCGVNPKFAEQRQNILGAQRENKHLKAFFNG